MTEKFSEKLPYGFASVEEQEKQTRRVMLRAGTAYGLIFGLSFALFTWGYDGLLLSSQGAAHPWLKLLLGLLPALLLGGFAGWLGAYSGSMVLSVVIWAATLALLGVIAAHIPFEGQNLFLWLAERRLWGEIVFSFDKSASVRATLVVLLGTLLGAVVGFFQNLSVQWAWDRATSDRRMSLGSWLVLLVCIPLALLGAANVTGFINQPLRLPQTAVGEIIHFAQSSVVATSDELESSLRSIRPFQQQMAGSFITHFVSFSPGSEAWNSAYVDVVFENSFVLRCVTVYDRVLYCDDYDSKFRAWMGQMARAGLYGERPWLDASLKLLTVNEDVLSWLSAHKDQLSESYDTRRDGQQEGWVFMTARFDTGFEMTCRFTGAQPVLVEQCQAGN